MAQRRGKLTKKHWLAIEILIAALIIFLALNVIQFPIEETETYTERVPYQPGEMMLVDAPYNETTCTQRDHKFEIEQGQIIPLQGNSAAFIYTLQNSENKAGTFRYKLGIATLYWARVAQTRQEKISFEGYTPEESTEVPANSRQQISIVVEGLKASDPYYGEIIVYPPQLEECQTVTEMTQVEVPATTTDFKDVERTREVIRYETLWERMFG
ncbi:hypothetical protein HYS48_02050 [Candidatus Woesearchaeota archaeon]|nr:hypothetical protein [Candidatus Woesearchaeota archaeon]